MTTNKQTLKAYYKLTKPGLVYGNALMAIAGYLFGAAGHGSWLTFLAMLSGVCLVMAAACVFNNIIDRDIDGKMKRTANRPLITGEISVLNAVIYGSALLVVSILLLGFGTNLLTLGVGLFGFVAYTGLYTYSKRKTVHSTLIGTLAGATPPVIGYLAATNSLDVVALLLFLLLVAWQMPHFYAISIFRRADYANANIPVLSVVNGVFATRQQMIAYAALFIVMVLLLGIYGGTSLLTVLILLLAASYWLCLTLQPMSEQSSSSWAGKVFGWSLWLLVIGCIVLSLDSFWH